MAYEKNTWQNGDIITKEKLNKMEDGISQANMGGKIEVTKTKEGTTIRYTLNKTYNEIVNLINNGVVPFMLLPIGGYDDSFNIERVSSFRVYEDLHSVVTYTIKTDGYQEMDFIATSPDEYLSCQKEDIV